MPSSLAGLVHRYRDLVRQFSTFVGVGLAATAAHFAALTLVVEEDLLGPVAGSAVGFVVGGIVSYSLNRRYTFETTRSHAGAVPRFMVIAGVAFGLNGLLMELLVHRLGLFYLLAQAITSGLIMLWTFSGYRLWAFAHRPGARQA
ncbi:GtrA family protein [Xanthobacter dioxanivorans]|uniref:GtrA family protein n=1 Tax=Xanthobacter dioxanivorans TaxID=2528964 RepID=A0A974PK34_9HYPH|nr:GtrA family protein [Xanthobacter dioxanivorans]QRG04490.1 GtrA family protein [Xanthobacter dioxanivorans]